MPVASSTSSAPGSSRNEMEERMREYQTFLSTVLRPDLERAQRGEQETATEVRDYKELHVKLKELKMKTTSSDPISMLVDLGHEKVFCNAEISHSASKIATKEAGKKVDDDATAPVPLVYVHVGMGFHVQFTIEEATVFVNQRLDFLENQVLRKRRVRLEEVKKHVTTSEMILSEIAAKLA